MTETQTAPALTGRAARMRDLLQAAFSPELLRIEDDSAKHAGHSGEREGGETHYSVRIVASAFAGLNRVARHRAVNAAVAPEFAAGLHALSVSARAPGET